MMVKAGCGFACAVLVSAQALQAQSWSLRHELTIGNKGDESALTHIVAVVPGPDDHLYVTQWRVPAVTVFSRSGAQVRTIGRQGQGPGEFLSPAAMGWKGDTLWAMDVAQSRISLFDRSGRFLTSVDFLTPPPTPYFRNLTPEALLADGSILSTGRPATSDLVAAGRVVRVPVLRMTRAGALIDTIATSEPTLDVTRLELAPNRGFTIARPLSSRPIITPTADGTALLFVERQPGRDRRRTAFRITKVSIAGDTLFSREYSYDPVPVGEPVRKRVYSQIVDNIAATEKQLPRARLEEIVRTALPLPAFHPPVSALVAGGDGSIWIRREDAGATSVSWDVINPAGVLAGVLKIPANLRIASANLNAVWAVTTDSLDVPTIQRFRVVRTTS